MGGVLVVNTHPDPNYLGNEKMLKVYQSFLAYLNQGGWQGILPHEIAKSVKNEPLTIRGDGSERRDSVQ